MGGAEDRVSSRGCFVVPLQLRAVETAAPQPPDVSVMDTCLQQVRLRMEPQRPQTPRESWTQRCDEQDPQDGTWSLQPTRVVTVDVEVLQTPMSTPSVTCSKGAVVEHDFGLPPSRKCAGGK